MMSCFFLAVTEWCYLTSSLESDAYTEEIFNQSPQQQQRWVDWLLQATDALASNETGAGLGESYFTCAAYILCDIWENFLCKLKPWTVCPLNDVFRFNNLTQKEQNHLFVTSLTGCILVDNENLMRFFANFNAETWNGFSKKSNFQHYCREMPPIKTENSHSKVNASKT